MSLNAEEITVLVVVLVIVVTLIVLLFQQVKSKPQGPIVL
jgi:hypothetical protein